MKSRRKGRAPDAAAGRGLQPRCGSLGEQALPILLCTPHPSSPTASHSVAAILGKTKPNSTSGVVKGLSHHCLVRHLVRRSSPGEGGSRHCGQDGAPRQFYAVEFPRNSTYFRVIPLNSAFLAVASDAKRGGNPKSRIFIHFSVGTNCCTMSYNQNWRCLHFNPLRPISTYFDQKINMGNTFATRLEN